MDQADIRLKQTKKLESPDILFCMRRVPESSRLYCGSSDFNVYEIELDAEEPRRRKFAGHRSFVTGVALAGDQTMVTSSWDRQLIWWDLDEGRLFRRILAHKKWIRSVVWSPDGVYLASVADDMICRIWDAQTGSLINELRGHDVRTPQNYPSMLFACTFSQDGAYLATGDKVGHVVVWNVARGEAIATLESPENYTWDPRQRRHSTGGIRSLRFSPDGSLLAVGGIGHIENIDGLGGKALVQIYDWRTGQRTHRFEHDEQKGLVEHLQFVRGGDWLVAGGGAKQGFFLFMELATEQFIHVEAAPMHIHEFEADDQLEQMVAVGHEAVAVWEVGSTST